MEKQMRIELASEYPEGGGYYYASLELPRRNMKSVTLCKK
jgi:hypothetical protein